MRRLRRATAITLAMLMAACATPTVPPPAAPPPAAFKQTGIWQRAAATTPAPPEAWWTLFGDPVLDDLQQRLVVDNQNLRVALAQVASARAAVDASRAARWPTLSAGAGATRARVAGEPARIDNPANSVSVSAAATWEVDLWGRLAEGVRAADARYQASADDLAALRLSAQAALAQTFITLRVVEAEQDLLIRTVAAYARAVDLTQARVDGGVAPPTDLLSAQTQLATAQAQQEDLAAQRAQLEHAIAVLVGVPPSALALAPSERIPAVPAVPELLPATLLQRRPDIAAAEQRVVAAYALAGQADAAWFPALTLSASGGYRNSALADLLSAPNLFWSLGPALAQAILDGGQRRLASEQARAAADAATAQYRQTVLTALQEVEDNLVLADRLGREALAQARAVAAAQRALEITQEQYKAGTVSFLAVFVAQTVALNAERALLEVRARQLAAVNQLLKNIAGTWAPVRGEG